VTDVHDEAPPNSSKRELVKSPPGAILWETDPWALRFSYVSASASEVLGYPPEQWQREARFLETHVPPDDWGQVLQTLYRATAEGGLHTCEHRMLTAAGETRWMHTTMNRGDDRGTALTVRGVSVDVTSIKEAELSLRDQEARCHLLLQSVRSAALFVLSREGNVESWTDGAQRLAGYPAEEIVGESVARLFPSEEVEKGTLERLLDRAALDFQARYEGVLVRRSGENFQGAMTLRAVLDEHQQVRGFSSVMTDVTEGEGIAKDLRESEAHFRRLVESVQDYAVFMMSPEGLVESWNRGAQRVKGYRAHEIVGESFARFFPPEDAKRVTDGLLARADREGTSSYEGLLIRKDGTAFWGQVGLSAVETDDGRLRGFSNVARDMTEHKRTEETLRGSEQHFRRLVESVQDYAVFMISPAGIVESWNRGAHRLKGYRAHEIVGVSITHFFPHASADRTTRELLAAAEREGTSNYEGWLVRKDRSMFWALLTLSAVESDEGVLQGFSNVARDLTERKKTEEALRESEERVRLLIESLRDHGVFMVSPEGQIAGWSPGAEQLHGYRAEEVVGEPLSRLFSPHAAEQGTPARLVERATADGHAEFEGWLVRKTGATFWGSLFLSAVISTQGELRGFSTVIADLTERLRAQREQAFLSEASRVLAGSLDFTRTLDEIAHLATREMAQCCIVTVLDDDAIRPLAFAHVDLEKERLLAEVVDRIPDDPTALHGIGHVIRTGQSEIRADISEAYGLAEAVGMGSSRILRELRVRSYMCVPLTAHGATLGAMAFLSSAEGRRYGQNDLRLAEALALRAAVAIENARSYRQARDAIRIREEILAVVSHDLRNPLSAIEIGTGLLLKAPSESGEKPDIPHVAGLIRRSTEQMQQMIRDLLDFSAIQEDRLHLEHEDHDAASLVTEALQSMDPAAAAKGVRLERDTDGLRAMVSCDRGKIARVFANLIGNAIKFTDAGGAVVVEARLEGERVRFSVRDTGPGIPVEELAHVFERYWQSARRSDGSVGLGLAIVKGIVEAHGGEIRVESEMGLGSTFSFSLPRR
jgi:PAS domain S-box-containing protein